MNTSFPKYLKKDIAKDAFNPNQHRLSRHYYLLGFTDEISREYNKCKTNKAVISNPKNRKDFEKSLLGIAAQYGSSPVTIWVDDFDHLLNNEAFLLCMKNMVKYDRYQGVATRSNDGPELDLSKVTLVFTPKSKILAFSSDCKAGKYNHAKMLECSIREYTSCFAR